MSVLLQYGTRYSFWCPGCKTGHWFQTSGPPAWQFDNNMAKPTVTPSILMHLGNGQSCHLFLTAGKINFCNDSWHELKGKQGVDMVDWDTILGEKKMDEPNTQEAPAPTESATSKVTSIDSAQQAGAPAAAATPPAAPAPHPGFDNAVTFMVGRGYSPSAAAEIVNIEGIDKVLALIPPQAPQTGPGVPGHPGDATNEAAAPPQAATGNEAAKDEEDHTGMKRCSACGVWYPGGYETCPQDNTRL